MTLLSNRKNKKFLIWAISVTLVVTLLIGACAIYLCDYYRADLDAIAAISLDGDFEQKELEGGNIVFEPEKIEAGFVLYPGGKVEHSAYIPLMRALAQKGILCVLVKMPFNLAFFDINAADEVRASYPSVEDWYIGGHSLGGAMAALHLEKSFAEYKGLVLLGAYSTADLSDKDLKTLSIYGSEDGVMDRNKYDSNKGNLPEDFSELVIEGGNHAYFGVYGAQDGDGKPLISNREQITLTADAIVEMILK